MNSSVIGWIDLEQIERPHQRLALLLNQDGNTSYNSATPFLPTSRDPSTTQESRAFVQSLLPRKNVMLVHLSELHSIPVGSTVLN